MHVETPDMLALAGKSGFVGTSVLAERLQVGKSDHVDTHGCAGWFGYEQQCCDTHRGLLDIQEMYYAEVDIVDLTSTVHEVVVRAPHLRAFRFADIPHAARSRHRCYCAKQVEPHPQKNLIPVRAAGFAAVLDVFYYKPHEPYACSRVCSAAAAAAAADHKGYIGRADRILMLGQFLHRYSLGRMDQSMGGFLDRALSMDWEGHRTGRWKDLKTVGSYCGHLNPLH